MQENSSAPKRSHQEPLETGASEESIRAHLRTIEIEAMGMANASGEPLLPDANRNAAAASLKELAHHFR